MSFPRVCGPKFGDDMTRFVFWRKLCLVVLVITAAWHTTPKCSRRRQLMFTISHNFYGP